MLLVLATDTLIFYRIRFVRRPPAAQAMAVTGAAHGR
jgi:hypothetical protein